MKGEKIKFKYLLEHLESKKQILEYQLEHKGSKIVSFDRLKDELKEITEAIKILKKEEK